MSRRQPSGVPASKSHLPRAASLASLAMPPPVKVPTRPPSAMASSAATTNAKHRDEQPGSTQSSPQRHARKTIGGVNGGSVSRTRGEGVGANESGEINIQVVVRCRGRSSQELAEASPIITSTSGPLSKAITIETSPMVASAMTTFTTASSYGGSNAPSTKTYSFDKVFGPEADQTMVFREVAEDMLQEVLAGYNCTIFAYGQTGTGKTFTMQGDTALTPLASPANGAGIIPRVLHRLFALLDNAKNTEYAVKCSYIELYNEELRDLLAPEYKDSTNSNSASVAGLKIYEDSSKKGVMIQGLEEAGIKSLKEGLAILDKGSQRRQVAETKMNSESSRSHSIFTLTVHIKESSLQSGGEDMIRIGKFNLVDLAGSEAIGRSGAENKRAREAGMINQSLLTLGRVISALVEKGSHIPYRESKLTRLLQDSLGGRTKTCIVATVSPTRSNMEETLSTLDYAIRAKSIRNKPEVNAHLTRTGLLKEYVGDIERLKGELLAAREKNGIYIPEDQWKEMHELHTKQKSDYEEAKQKAVAIAIELDTRKQEFDELTSRFVMTTEELEQVREAERQLSALLEVVKDELETTKVALAEEHVVSEAFQRGEEHLDEVATNLKTIATNSIADVDKLFDKIARKAKVLGTNTHSAIAFGAQLQDISQSMKQGMSEMAKDHQEASLVLESQLRDMTERLDNISKDDESRLESMLEAFNDLSKSLSKSIEKSRIESSDASATVLSVKDEIDASVRSWARGVSERSTYMVDDLVKYQQEQFKMIRSVFASTVSIVEDLVSSTRDHLAAEAAAAARSQQVVQDTATAEIAHLRAQNALLANLVINEKAKSQKLRDSLVSNIAGMLNDFTESQDQSLQEAIEQVQAANAIGLAQMDKLSTAQSDSFNATSARSTEMALRLDGHASTTESQKSNMQTAFGEIDVRMRSRLQGYAQETSTGANEHVDVVTNFCDQLSTAASKVSSTAENRSRKQLSAVATLMKQNREVVETSKRRTHETVQDVATVTSSVLEQSETSTAVYNERYAIAERQLASLASATSVFLRDGVLEDLSTGVTPKKKIWDVPHDWERTRSRDELIASVRKQKSPVSIMEDADNVNTEAVESILPTVSSTASMASINSASTASSRDSKENAAPALSSSLMRTSRAKPSSKLAVVGGVNNDEFQRPHVAVLGEGGNIPRRIRK